MSDRICVKDISSWAARRSKANVDDAISSISAMSGNGFSVYYSCNGVKSSLFSADTFIRVQNAHLKLCRIQTQLEVYARILDKGPNELLEIDANCKNSLTNFWERTARDLQVMYQYVVDMIEDVPIFSFLMTSGVTGFWLSIKENYTEVEWAKIGLTGLVIVGGIVASVVTGGAAAPIVIGAISGAIIAGGNTAIDQYAEHGWDMDNWDYAEIGKDAFIGAVTGAVTAWIGGNLTKGVTNLASSTQWGSTLLNSSNAYVRVGTGAFIGSFSEVVSGVGSRGTGAFISTMIETDGDLGKSLSGAVDYAFDGKEIAQDAVLGGVQGGTDALTAPVGERITQDNIDQLEKYSDTKPERNPDLKKWIENGGEVYVDANGKYTFVSADGRKCVYEDGYPDFRREGYVEATYTTEGFDVSNHNADINLAKKNTGLGGKGSGSTWHHSTDGKTLELVPREVHELFRHTGGFALAKRGD